MMPHDQRKQSPKSLTEKDTIKEACLTFYLTALQFMISDGISQTYSGLFMTKFHLRMQKNLYDEIGEVLSKI